MPCLPGKALESPSTIAIPPTTESAPTPTGSAAATAVRNTQSKTRSASGSETSSARIEIRLERRVEVVHEQAPARCSSPAAASGSCAHAGIRRERVLEVTAQRDERERGGRGWVRHRADERPGVFGRHDGGDARIAAERRERVAHRDVERRRSLRIPEDGDLEKRGKFVILTTGVRHRRRHRHQGLEVGSAVRRRTFVEV